MNGSVDDLLLQTSAAALKAVKCDVIPAYGDPNGSHVMIEVVSAEFEGKRSVQRQQMVYKVGAFPSILPPSFSHHEKPDSACVALVMG